MINTLIFDFGNVFINLNDAYTLDYIKHFESSDDFEDILKTNVAFERGEISTNTFLDRYTKFFPNQSKETIIYKWNSILEDFPKHRLDFLKGLKENSKYKLILLSNTNDLHMSWIRKNIPFYNIFKNCFDAFYLSHEINLRKPDADAFLFVLGQNHLKANQCLFIDDNAENIKAANRLNINTWHITPKKEDVIELFKTKHNLFK